MAEQANELHLEETQKQEVEAQGAERTQARAAFVPRTDIYETESHMVMVADMPGVDENSVEITVEKNVLTIKGHVEDEVYDDKSLAYAEYRVGDFQRSFSISNEIDQEGIEATVRNGVLQLMLPKISPVTKRIAVQAG